MENKTYLKPIFKPSIKIGLRLLTSDGVVIIEVKRCKQLVYSVKSKFITKK